MRIGNIFSGKFLFLPKGTKRIILGISRKYPYLWLAPDWIMFTFRNKYPKKYMLPEWLKLPIPKWKV